MKLKEMFPPPLSGFVAHVGAVLHDDGSVALLIQPEGKDDPAIPATRVTLGADGTYVLERLPESFAPASLRSAA